MKLVLDGKSRKSLVKVFKSWEENNRPYNSIFLTAVGFATFVILIGFDKIFVSLRDSLPGCVSPVVVADSDMIAFALESNIEIPQLEKFEPLSANTKDIVGKNCRYWQSDKKVVGLVA